MLLALLSLIIPAGGKGNTPLPSGKAKKRLRKEVVKWLLDYGTLDDDIRADLKDPQKWLNAFNGYLRTIKQTESQFMTRYLEQHQPQQEYSRVVMYKKIPHYNIFGCPLSQDTDIVVVVDKDTHQFAIHPDDIIMLQNYFQSKGYVPDINYVWFNPNGSFELDKGGKETANIVLETYQYHTNECPIIFGQNHWTENTVLEKLSVFGKFILDKFKDNVPHDTYKKYHEEKRQNYSNGIGRITTALKFLRMFNTTITDENIGLWKSIIMKFTQVLLLTKSITRGIYTKEGLADLFQIHYPEIEHQDIYRAVLLKTFRGDLPEKIIDTIVICINKLSKDEFPTFGAPQQLIVTNTTPIIQSVFDLFVNSPITPTDEFIDEWLSTYGPSVQNHFIEMNQNVDYLPQSLLPYVYDIPQRTKYWQRLYNVFFTCGRNSGIVSRPTDPREFVKTFYNLIMGCIGECIVTGCYPFDDTYTKVTVGMIVEDNVEGAKGICPDLLLVRDGEIVVVEIKTIAMPQGFVQNAVFYREMKLARKQVQQTKSIIQQHSGGKVSGMTVFLILPEFKTVVEYI